MLLITGVEDSGESGITVAQGATSNWCSRYTGSGGSTGAQGADRPTGAVSYQQQVVILWRIKINF